MASTYLYKRQTSRFNQNSQNTIIDIIYYSVRQAVCMTYLDSLALCAAATCEILASKTEWCRAQSPTSGLYTCMVVHGLTADATLVRTATALARGREPACQRMLGWTLKMHRMDTLPSSCQYPDTSQTLHRGKGELFPCLTYFKSSSMLWLLHINCITNNAN